MRSLCLHSHCLRSPPACSGRAFFGDRGGSPERVRVRVRVRVRGFGGALMPAPTSPIPLPVIGHHCARPSLVTPHPKPKPKPKPKPEPNPNPQAHGLPAAAGIFPAARPRGQTPAALAVPRRGSCAPLGRAWRLWAARLAALGDAALLKGAGRATGRPAPPLRPVLEPAASKSPRFRRACLLSQAGGRRAGLV